MRNINNPELQELADIAAQFVKPREGQHGAMQRALVGGLSAMGGGPTGLAALAGSGRATNAVLNSNMAKNMAMGTKPNALGNPRLEALLRVAPVGLQSDR